VGVFLAIMENKKFIIKRSNIDNLGAFAIKDISKGEFIIDYIGEKITNKEAERREEINDELGITYIFCLDDETCIDGSVGGNDSRFINHSCDPNCDYVIEDGKILIFSDRLIKKGEELTIDYEYSKDSKKEICRCGNKNCRGFINEA
jgi:uncharacterized protein